MVLTFNLRKLCVRSKYNTYVTIKCINWKANCHGTNCNVYQPLLSGDIHSRTPGNAGSAARDPSFSREPFYARVSRRRGTAFADTYPPGTAGSIDRSLDLCLWSMCNVKKNIENFSKSCEPQIMRSHMVFDVFEKVYIIKSLEIYIKKAMITTIRQKYF